MSNFSVQFDIEGFSLWAPHIHNEQAVDELCQQCLSAKLEPRDDEMPDVSFIPAMQRRRLSRLSKMSLYTLQHCYSQHHEQLDQETSSPYFRTVFASPHGEIHRTVDLLRELAKGEPISPMGFSLSVHNTAAGIYSIFSGNQAASTSVASGRDTLEQAIVEAVSQSHHHQQSVMMIYADEPLPDEYRTEFPVPFPFSLALLLRHNPAGQYQLSAINKIDEGDTQSQSVYGGRLQLIPLLYQKTATFISSGERNDWQWGSSEK